MCSVINEATMATKTKGNNARVQVQDPAPEQAPVPATNMFNQLVKTPEQVGSGAPAPRAGVATKASAVIAQNPGALNTVGVALTALPPSIAAKGTVPGRWTVTVATTTYRLGAKLQGGGCPARGVHDVACVAKVQALGASFTAAQAQAAGVPWHSMAAYLKRQWVTVAQ